MVMMKRVKPALAAAAILLTLAGTAYAQTVSPATVQKPAVGQVGPVNADGTIMLEGTLEYVELEGGYYMVGDWALMGEHNFNAYLGKAVTVTGREFTGVSIRMVKSLVVSQVALKGRAAQESDGKVVEAGPIAEPVVADGQIALEGTVEYVDLEGGFYSLDGWGLLGDEALLRSLVGKQATVRGVEFTGMSFRQVRQLEIGSVTLAVSANRPLPAAVTINGKRLPPGQEPMVIDGVLMLPLRHVVETAGGRVEWDPKERAVVVTLPDRMAYFWVGQSEAEMNQNNVRYFARNMIAMAKAPVIVQGRTMIAADALTKVLGLHEVADLDTSLDLIVTE